MTTAARIAKRIIIAVPMCMAGCSAESPDVSEPVPPDPPSASQAANRGFDGNCNRTGIERSAYRKFEGNLMGYSAEGSHFEAYRDGDRVKLATITHYGETGQALEEFHYDEDGRLLCVVRTESRYDEPFGDTQRTISSEFYFEHDTLVHWIEDGAIILPADNTEYRQHEKELLEFSELLIDETGQAMDPAGPQL